MGVRSNGTIIFESPYLKVSVNLEEGALIYKWIGHIQEADAKKGMNLITDNISKHSFTNMLADLSEFKGGSINIARWVNEVWSESLKEAGLQKLAINIPTGAFADFSHKISLGAKTVSLLEVNKVTSYEDAYSWFKQS